MWALKVKLLKKRMIKTLHFCDDWKGCMNEDDVWYRAASGNVKVVVTPNVESCAYQLIQPPCGHSRY